MAGHPLIRAQLDRLRDQLPADLVDEVADGLEETYTARLAVLRDQDQAARAAVEDFGDAPTILRAAWKHSPARRHATLLLATGPIAAAAWAPTLLIQQAWQWPIPAPLRWLVGGALLATVALVLAVLAGGLPYRRRRPTLVAGTLALVALDVFACTLLLRFGSVSAGIVIVAAGVSLMRTTMVAVPGLIRLLRAV